MTTRYDGMTLYTQNFNIENELTSVVVNGQTTSFSYDAAGMRVKPVQPNGSLIATPFPDYKVENPGRNTPTTHITLSIAGQAIAQRIIFSDHLGGLIAVQDSGGGLTAGSRTYYDPLATIAARLSQP